MTPNCSSLFSPSSSNTHIAKHISECLAGISAWTAAHYLRLNLDKNEILFITGKDCPYIDLSVTVEDVIVSPSSTARNLDVILNNGLLSPILKFFPLQHPQDPACPTKWDKKLENDFRPMYSCKRDIVICEFLTKQWEVATVFGKESSTVSISLLSLALAQSVETKNGESDIKGSHWSRFTQAFSWPQSL